MAGCRCGPCLTGAARLAADPADGAPAGYAETETLFDAAMDGWREVTDPLLGPLMLAAARSSSFDEALAMIAKRGPDGSMLLERLAAATAKARGIGDVMD